MIYTRWLIRRDLPEVLAIEAASFSDSWTEDDMIRALRRRDTICIVAEIDDVVVGYAVYRLRTLRVEIERLAVSPSRRRCGVGRELVEHIARRQGNRRKLIDLRVSEENLPAHQWLRAIGFRAESVFRGYYGDGHDAYWFVRQIAAWQHSVPVATAQQGATS